MNNDITIHKDSFTLTHFINLLTMLCGSSIMVSGNHAMFGDKSNPRNERSTGSIVS